MNTKEPLGWDEKIAMTFFCLLLSALAAGAWLAVFALAQKVFS